LGIDVRALTARDRQDYGVPATTTGLVVTNVDPGGPLGQAAAAAELNPTGLIVQRIGHTDVAGKTDFDRAVKALNGKDSVTVIVLYSMDGMVHQEALSVRL
jgi:S1-C subfamily serine protease